MKRFTIFSLTCFLSMGSVFAQQGSNPVRRSDRTTEVPFTGLSGIARPCGTFRKEWAAVTAPQVSWGTIDVRYAKHQLPALKKTTNTSL